MRIDALSVHGGFSGGSGYGETVSPIYQTVTYSYKTAKGLACVFAGTAPGYIYTRIANPTTAALESRLTELENDNTVEFLYFMGGGHGID